MIDSLAYTWSDYACTLGQFEPQLAGQALVGQCGLGWKLEGAAKGTSRPGSLGSERQGVERLHWVL
jgi:hypothetical protein